MKNLINISFNFRDLLINFTLALIFFLLISLFFSFQKIIIVFIFSIFFFLINYTYKKFIIINLTIIIILLKIVFIFFDPSNTLSKTIYEKHFLYGVKNLSISSTINGGNMDPKNKTNSKQVNIITDQLGFRNNLNLNDVNYIIIGDSFIHNTRIDNKNLLNEKLNLKSKNKFYNAALSAQDIAHYFETIKYFKDENYNKKFIMFVFTGNDFLSYEKTKKNYSKYLGNFFLRSYFEIKEFFDIYTKIKFIFNFFKQNEIIEKVDYSKKINDQKILFYKSYYISKDQTLSFSKEFNLYEKYKPDILIVIPTKAQVYCEYIENYDCPKINYVNLFNKINLFKNTIVFDSTNYMSNKADKYLLNNKFIFEENDTHLNEIGLDVLSDFVLYSLNELN